MSPSGGRDQTFLPRTRAVLLDITVSMGFSSIPLPSTGKLPSTTAGELSPKSFSPDFPMASSAPDRENFALQLTEMPTPRSLSLGFFAQPSSPAFFRSSFVALFLPDDNRMLNIYFCSCLALTQMATGAACTCPLSLSEGRPSDLQTFRPGFAVTFYSTELSLLD